MIGFQEGKCLLCGQHGILNEGICERHSAEVAQAYLFGIEEGASLSPQQQGRDNERPCPFCDGNGFTVKEVTGYGHACDGTEASCARNCPVPVPEQQQEACEFCLTTGKVYALSTPSPSPWRTMEDAPKDGTTILTWCAEREAVTMAFWLEIQQRWSGLYETWTPDEPTHWQPLPKAPEKEGA